MAASAAVIRDSVISVTRAGGRRHGNDAIADDSCDNGEKDTNVCGE